MFNNLLIKILSLILACLLWFFVVVENKPEAVFQVPLMVENLQGGLGLSTNYRDYLIEIKLKGPESVLGGLTAQQLKVTVDLSKATEGNWYFNLTENDITVPDYAQVIRIAPSEVHLVIEPIVQRIVPVEPVILGVPAKGYSFEGVRVFPDHVKLSGVRSLVIAKKSVRTISIDISQMTSSPIHKVDLVPLDRRLSLDKSGGFEVRPIIKENSLEKIFADVMVSPLPPGRKVKLFPGKVTVAVKGPKSGIEKMKSENIQASVNILNLKPGKNLSVVKVKLADVYKIISIEPREISVEFVEEKGNKLLRPAIKSLP